MKTSAIRDGFQHRDEEPRFFVRTLGSNEPKWAEGYRWEIQFLNQRGCRGYEILLSDDDALPVGLPFELPTAVIAAARRMSSGGDYLSTDGLSTPPF